MIDAVLETLDAAVKPEDCVMVGDRLYTDIKMALNAGMASALVLTGETTIAGLELCEPEDRPDYVLERIDRLVPGLWNGAL